MQPELIVLDEPTSNLDLDAINELREIIAAWKAQGKTIVIAEHRLSWLKGLCDKVLLLEGGSLAKAYTDTGFFSLSDAQLNETGLRAISQKKNYLDNQTGLHQISDYACADTITLDNFIYSYGKEPALYIEHMELPKGAVIAVVGHNGAGKSTLTKCLCGLQKKFCGTVIITHEIKRYAALFVYGHAGCQVQRALTGFAAGVMTAASIWSLIIPAMDMAEDKGKLAFLPAVIGFWCGILFLLLLDTLIPHLHMNAEKAEGVPSKLARTTMMVLAVTLHNIPEGMAGGIVYAGFLSGSAEMSAGGAFALALGIAIQNFPEGAIISMPLHAEGKSKIGTVSGFPTILLCAVGIILTLTGIVIWFTGAMRSDMDENIKENRLKTNGIYAWVRNPMYSGLWILISGISLMWHNVFLILVIFINWYMMTVVLKNTEEKWLRDLYGQEYDDYCKRVNRCIPWKRTL